MNTKEKIIAAIESQRNEIESECFCRVALTGGYEDFIRDFLFEGLSLLGEENLRAEYTYSKLNTKGNNEYNRVDLISGNPNNLDYFVELGHNGTWQSPFSLINHAIDDINRSFDFSISTKERFTISILTNILDFSEKETFRFRQSYIEGIRDNISDNQKKLIKTRAFFKRLDKYTTEAHIEIPKMSPLIWKGFQVDIHIFVAGSFNREITKKEIK